VTLYKGHLGVGVTEPSGQLELAGDERIQEYPPGPMDDYETLIPGHGVFCAYASTDYGATPYRSWNAFNKSITTVGGSDGWASAHNTWLNDGTTTPVSSNAAVFDGVECHWLALQLPYEVKPTLVTLRARNDNNVPTEVPAKGRIYGSKDGVTWNQIRSYNIRTEVGTLQAGTVNAPIPITLTTNEYYTHLLLTVDERYGGAVGSPQWTDIGELRYFGTPGPTTLDKGSLTLGRSLDVPRISRYDVDTETPRYEKLVVDFDTTVNSSATDISGQGNHGTMVGATYSAADKAFNFNGSSDYIDIEQLTGVGTGAWVHSKSFWFKLHSSTDPGIIFLLGRNDNTKQIAVQVNGSGQFQYFIYGCNSRVQVNGSDWYPDVNRWYHCVTVFKNNETTANDSVLTGREMYIDGVKQTLVALNTQISLNLDSSQVRFGNQFNTTYLDYQLSNPKLYSVALEPSEVRKLYNLGRTGRSMVISDTAVGIGKVPEAQLDVRGLFKASTMHVPGTIVQVQAANLVGDSSTNDRNTGHRNSFVKLNIKPRFKNSAIIADFKFLVYIHTGDASANGAECLVRRCVNFNPTSLSTTGVNVYAAGGHNLHYYRINPNSDHIYISLTEVDTPNTMENIYYVMAFRPHVHGNHTISIGNGSNQFATVRLMEIAQ
jgi:hypothetical protein